MVNVREDEDQGVGTLIARAVADGRAYASAEIEYWRVLAADRLADVRSLAILAVVALFLVNAAAIALVVGLVMTLTPLVGPGLATLIVVVVALAVAGLFGMLALKRFRRATRPRNEP